MSFFAICRDSILTNRLYRAIFIAVLLKNEVKMACKTDRILQGGQLITVKEAARRHITRSALAYQCKRGRLVRLCRGVYAPANAIGSPYPDLEQVVKKEPFAVVCLLSALQIHEMTTQSPTALWIALPQGRHLHKMNTSPIVCIHLSEQIHSRGIVEKEIYGFKIKIYSPARTVADCFKFRNKIGINIAMEALRDGYRKKLFTIPEITEEAEFCHVGRIITPYIESLFA